jgi:glutamyl-Q tRNA(Asp) synthetase
MTDYIGRFAPSPTGPLHLGSLVAAVASYLQAKTHSGSWLVRIEDIDPPREMAGASQDIIDGLHAHGFDFATPAYQSHRLDEYAQKIDQLLKSGAAYPCFCSRQDIRKIAKTGRIGHIYPGTCRHGQPVSGGESLAVRYLTDGNAITFTDALQGVQRCNLEAEIGDFLIRRRDGRVGYQLAVALDDANQGVTQVVRGIDLLDSTFPQLALLRAFGLAEPAYMHVPVVVNQAGQKLSKQHGAPALCLERPEKNLFNSLFLLNQNPPQALRHEPLESIWNWAVTNWTPSRLSGQRAIAESAII